MNDLSTYATALRDAGQAVPSEIDLAHHVRRFHDVVPHRLHSNAAEFVDFVATGGPAPSAGKWKRTKTYYRTMSHAELLRMADARFAKIDDDDAVLLSRWALLPTDRAFDTPQTNTAVLLTAELVRRTGGKYTGRPANDSNDTRAFRDRLALRPARRSITFGGGVRDEGMFDTDPLPLFYQIGTKSGVRGKGGWGTGRGHRRRL